ncbi:hypothetical protein QAD02_007253 [Eretmocerus hayati]|uniref:Uncharacterized protein n=1 Tax=Eretmocerus hayati TaxID=131215 RepID=A0ACC2N4H2_9HYME|nr:hypothetical protein QAD02_007253 [Eretmocerus hayati]
MHTPNLCLPESGKTDEFPLGGATPQWAAQIYLPEFKELNLAKYHIVPVSYLKEFPYSNKPIAPMNFLDFLESHEYRASCYECTRNSILMCCNKECIHKMKERKAYIVRIDVCREAVQEAWDASVKRFHAPNNNYLTTSDSDNLAPTDHNKMQQILLKMKTEEIDNVEQNSINESQKQLDRWRASNSSIVNRTSPVRCPKNISKVNKSPSAKALARLFNSPSSGRPRKSQYAKGPASIRNQGAGSQVLGTNSSHTAPATEQSRNEEASKINAVGEQNVAVTNEDDFIVTISESLEGSSQEEIPMDVNENDSLQDANHIEPMVIVRQETEQVSPIQTAASQSQPCIPRQATEGGAVSANPARPQVIGSSELPARVLQGIQGYKEREPGAKGSRPWKSFDCMIIFAEHFYKDKSGGGYRDYKRRGNIEGNLVYVGEGLAMPAKSWDVLQANTSPQNFVREFLVSLYTEEGCARRSLVPEKVPRENWLDGVLDDWLIKNDYTNDVPKTEDPKEKKNSRLYHLRKCNKTISEHTKTMRRKFRDEPSTTAPASPATDTS